MTKSLTLEWVIQQVSHLNTFKDTWQWHFLFLQCILIFNCTKVILNQKALVKLNRIIKMEKIKKEEEEESLPNDKEFRIF